MERNSNQSHKREGRGSHLHALLHRRKTLAKAMIQRRELAKREPSEELAKDDWDREMDNK